MDLEKYDSLVLRLARKSAQNPADIDDLTQIAKIKIWELLESGKPDHFGYISTVVENLFRQEYKKARTQKRNPGSPVLSINQELTEGFTIEETLGQGDDLIFKDDMLESLYQGLVEKYGKKWVHEIQNEKRPIFRVRKIIKAVIEDIAQLEMEEIPQKIDYDWFVEMGLGRILWIFYNNSPSRAVMDCYKGDYNAWDFSRVPNGFWVGKNGYKNAVQAIGWLLNRKSIITVDDCKKVGHKDFLDVGLAYMLQKYFSNSPYLALKTHFPELKPWGTKGVPKRYFTTELNRETALIDYCISSGIGNIKELSTEELHDSRFREISTKSKLSQGGLRTLLHYSGGSSFELFHGFFPQVRPWSMHAQRPWRENPLEIASEAIRWLFDDYLGIEKSEIPKYATYGLFRNVNFTGVLTNKRLGFNGSPYLAIDNAYPGEFSKSDFGRGRKTKSFSRN